MPVTKTLSPPAPEQRPGRSAGRGISSLVTSPTELDRLIEELRRDLAELERRWI